MLYTSFESPIGELLAVGDGQALHGLYMQEGRTAIAVRADWEPAHERSERCARSSRTTSTAGARSSICRSRCRAPRSSFGPGVRCRTSRTARRSATASRPGGSATRRDPRAVGQANGRNPIAVIVPCHRVIGADGSLTGYGGGLERKRRLLELEAGVLSLV